MFDILVYVFENYLPEACPEPGALARKLSAVGFEEEEISAALQWLAGLEELQQGPHFLRSPRAGTQRLFDETEQLRLTADCRGYLAALEQAGAIDAATREMIVECAMAVESTDSPVVSLAKFKVIVLTVMWRRDLPLDHLVFADLCDEDDEHSAAVMH